MRWPHPFSSNFIEWPVDLHSWHELNSSPCSPDVSTDTLKNRRGINGVFPSTVLTTIGRASRAKAKTTHYRYLQSQIWLHCATSFPVPSLFPLTPFRKVKVLKSPRSLISMTAIKFPKTTTDKLEIMVWSEYSSPGSLHAHEMPNNIWTSAMGTTSSVIVVDC